MRGRWWLAAAMVASGAWLPATVEADTATIETTRKIEGVLSEDSLRAALRSAVQAAAAGAAAMGLPFVMVDAAFVLPGAVTVRVLATDTPPSTDADAREQPGAEPAPRAKRPARAVPRDAL